MFRFKPGIHVSYEQQGYIYFMSLKYPEMEKEKQQKIRQLCVWAAGDNAPALLECVTTQEHMRSICDRHYIASLTTMYRALKKYYEGFPANL